MTEDFKEGREKGGFNLDEMADEQLRKLRSEDLGSDIADDQLLRAAERLTPGSTDDLENANLTLDADNPFLQAYVRRSRVKSELRTIEKPIPPGPQHDEERWERGRESLKQVKMDKKGKEKK